MTRLVGHDAQIAALLGAARSDRLHHAWLLAGPQGIGKARFADMAAARLLAEAVAPLPGDRLDLPSDHPTARLIAAGSHPDLARLERATKEKTGELARSITVDQVRGLARLFATTPSFSQRRVVVIDAVDDLERSAANALLKSLEEPPAGTLFLLVSHAPGRLLPTIRSRCRIVRFDRLDDAAMQDVLTGDLPDASNAEIEALVRLGGGAPGSALRFSGLDVNGLDRALDRLAREGDPTNALRSTLARELSGKAAQARYEIFLERAPTHIATLARTRRGAALARALREWEAARTLAAGAVRLSLDPAGTVFTLAGHVAALAPTGSAAKA